MERIVSIVGSIHHGHLHISRWIY